MRTDHKLQWFMDTLKLHQTAVQLLLEVHPDLDGDDTEAGAALAEFGMPGESHLTPLSGKQNDRDTLSEFVGRVVLVIHDGRLISRVCKDEESSELWHHVLILAHRFFSEPTLCKGSLPQLMVVSSFIKKLRFKVTEEETTAELEDKGINYNKMENPINEVNGVNFCIS
ncbi:hypothetical protein QYE76_031121 [Lolium multiflorum]|uniref:Uncharacterized protein n=1 Tax=Lolium multiflorum TaxID=4521 RepID=A0AAD8QR15_LOLMU|nr:hypothetical protein QYE76_031121 [Lolium multiflorum]